MCNNNNSAADKSLDNGAHFGNGSAKPISDYRVCHLISDDNDNNNIETVNQLKRYSAIHERPKPPQPQLFKSISLNINANGKVNTVPLHQHSKTQGFACFCCEPVEPQTPTLNADYQSKTW